MSLLKSLLLPGVMAGLLLTACESTRQLAQTPADTPPPALREFRAAWIATVANINWPSKPGLSTEEQKREAIALLDQLQQLHFNAAILQVRPQCDALYESKLEPWSYFLTGQQGQAPTPYYDPLSFWIEEAHRRGIELHVWLNPYRAHHKDGKAITDKSIVKTRPELVHYLEEGYWWMDPALPGTRAHSTAVVMDLVNRYDIDGVHFDDYFYPYPSYNKGKDFPDSVAWKAYRDAGGKMSRGDWRRDAVNRFIRELYQQIKAAKPSVKFGISPFGIWRPGYPPMASGFDQYEELYADARLWLREGWLDYFTPQLYWPISRTGQSFPILLGWWQEENINQRHLWPGLSIGRDTSRLSVMETVNQLMITRGILPKSMGAVHWSIGPLLRNTKLREYLLENTYRQQALIPASPWLDNKAPAAPSLQVSFTDSARLQWQHPEEKDVFQWVVYSRYDRQWSYQVLPAAQRALNLPLSLPAGNNQTALRELVLTAIDRNGNESVPEKKTRD